MCFCAFNAHLVRHGTGIPILAHTETHAYHSYACIWTCVDVILFCLPSTIVNEVCYHVPMLGAWCVVCVRAHSCHPNILSRNASLQTLNQASAKKTPARLTVPYVSDATPTPPCSMLSCDAARVLYKIWRLFTAATCPLSVLPH